MSKPYAVIAITKHGVSVARRLHRELSECDVYYPRKFASGDEEGLAIAAYDSALTDLIPTLFRQYKGLICLISLGATVRLVAPFLQDKKTDPAIVVVDDRAQYAISVLSGHLGGANDLARRVAQILGATPVITTASDVEGTVAVDLLGREFGFVIANPARITAVSAAVVNGERVHIIQEAGERNWWTSTVPLPSNLHVYSDVDAALQEAFAATLVITPRLLSPYETEQLLANGVLYRPKVVVIGIGCNRKTTATEIAEGIQGTLAELRLSVTSVRALATIDRKADEPGLLEVCRRYDWPLLAYSAEELNRIPVPHPSEVVYRHVGAWGVCEPAARLASGADDWWLEKKKLGNVTLSVCLAGEASGKLRKG